MDFKTICAMDYNKWLEDQGTWATGDKDFDHNPLVKYHDWLLWGGTKPLLHERI